MGCWSAAAISLAFLVLLLVLNFGGAEGKRGCANFGHSCYGGMGKRALEDLSSLTSNNEETVSNPDYLKNAGLVFTGPRSEIFNPYVPQRLQQYEQFSRILKQWIQSHRKPQTYLRDVNLV